SGRGAAAFFDGLFDGDPVAWIFLVLIIVSIPVGYFWRFGIGSYKGTFKPSDFSKDGTSGPSVTVASGGGVVSGGGAKCPVCQGAVAPNPGNDITCPGCQAVFPSP
ncbi:MAG: hypothetical protein N2C14_09820, partial [Planctomycetales bacterium]